MNRLIIIGNGFDLAHGLKTSYSDFIRDYWSKVKFPHDDRFYSIIPPAGTQKIVDYKMSSKAEVFGNCYGYDMLPKVA